ncbi:hypothetical protein EL09_22570 [Salmonella enterica subsp. enterica]|nr:hypothetical protein [Salmonella enterica subsp. enterica]MIF52454.1 hypothetical protein [Salmonella enterica subsp. enterica]
MLVVCSLFLPVSACFLCEVGILPVKFPLILPSKRPEMLSPEPFLAAECSYSQITARDLSTKLKPSCAQSARRSDFKVRGFL